MGTISKLYSDFFVARTPLLPLNTTKVLGNDNFAKLEGDNLNRYLTPELLEAIYLASPVLFDEVQKIQTSANRIKQGNKPKEKKRRVLLSLIKYINRASNRCTPFGLFSGCSFGKIVDEDSNLTVTNEHIKHLRLDMDVLCRLANRLKAEPAIRRNLHYRVNPVIYKTSGKQLKYIEYKYDQKGRRTFHLNKTPTNWIINEMLKISEAQSLEVIAERISSKFQFELVEVYDYLNDLIANNVLLSSIEPNVTGSEFFHVIRCELERICLLTSEVNEIVDVVRKIHAKIEQIKVAKGDISLYREVKTLLAGLLSDEDLEENKIFQVDLIKSGEELILKSDFVNDVVASISEMNSINNRVDMDSYYLKRFKYAFKELYPNQVVKLTDLLDYEVGLGYRKLNHRLKNEQESKAGGNFEKLAFKKYLAFIKNHDKEIVVTEQDLKPYQNVDTGLPKAFSIMGSVVQNESESLFSLASTPLSTTSLLGRFCHADPRISNHIKEFTDKENAHNKQEAIIAEIAHLPQSRIGNILSRPALTEWEIEFLSFSTLGERQRISIDELYLTLSSGELILLSKRLGKRIIPRLSSAHNYSSHSLDIYHLLCDLQHQGRNFIKVWDWGEKLRGEVYLPRVTYKNVILSQARWLFDCKEVMQLIKVNNSSFQKELQVFKDRYDLPDVFIQKQADNFLVIDSNNPLFVSYLENQAQSRSYLEFSEYIFSEGASPFYDIVGDAYANEVIIPVINDNHQPGKIPSFSSLYKIQHSAKRTFFLGDKWLYLKIYAKAKAFNSILLKVLPVFRRLKKEGWIEKFFFIRYADPMPHIRLRFLSETDKGIVINKLNEKLSYFVDRQVVVDVVSEKYERELERYGTFPIELSEKAFDLNSDLVLSYLNLKKRIMDIHLFAVFIVEKSLLELNLSFEQRHQVYKAGFSLYAKEFNYFGDKNLRRILSKEFKMRHQDIVQVFDDGRLESSLPVKKYIRSLRKMTKACRPFNLVNGKQDFLMSHIHMFANRLFSERQRYEEFVVYYLLDKYYRYKVASNKK